MAPLKVYFPSLDWAQISVPHSFCAVTQQPIFPDNYFFFFCLFANYSISYFPASLLRPSFLTPWVFASEPCVSYHFQYTLSSLYILVCLGLAHHSNPNADAFIYFSLAFISEGKWESHWAVLMRYLTVLQLCIRLPWIWTLPFHALFFFSNILCDIFRP